MFKKGILISIHALREESDFKFGEGTQKYSLFQSTLSARRATLWTQALKINLQISIHALREESDLTSPHPLKLVCNISIHALREESDTNKKQFDVQPEDFNPRSPRGERLTRYRFFVLEMHFNPRSPRGERRKDKSDSFIEFLISIHALREESD